MLKSVIIIVVAYYATGFYYRVLKFWGKSTKILAFKPSMPSLTEMSVDFNGLEQGRIAVTRTSQGYFFLSGSIERILKPWNEEKV